MQRFHTQGRGTGPSPFLLLIPTLQMGRPRLGGGGEQSRRARASALRFCSSLAEGPASGPLWDHTGREQKELEHGELFTRWACPALPYVKQLSPLPVPRSLHAATDPSERRPSSPVLSESPGHCR